MTTKALRFAIVLLAALLCATPALLAGETVEESSTGVAFEVTAKSPEGDAELALTGTGVRKKFGLAKVYGFGFYVDPAVAREGLAAWKGKNAGALKDDAKLYEAMIDLEGDRLAVMAFVRKVGAEKMQDALDDAMDLGVEAGDPARKAFIDLWSEKIGKGEKVQILVSAEGVVSVFRKGEKVGSVESAAVGRALLLSWLGPDTVSEDIREGSVERLPEILGAP